MPAGGYSFGPLDLPPVIPPEQQALSPELPPLVDPIPVEAAFEPAPMVPVTGPVELDVGPAKVKPVAPVTPPAADRPPVVDMLGAQPAPVSGPDVEIAKGLDRQRNLGQARVAAEQDSVTAAQDYRAAAEAWQAATTPAARAAAEKAAADAQQRMQGAQAVAHAAGLAQEREDAAQEATVSEAITAARTAKLAEVADVLNTRAAATQAKVDEAAAIRAKAQERRAAREHEYATVLERGPQDKTATWTSAIGMIGEMFSAYAQKRQPNFDVWLQRGLDMAREKHKGELDAMRTRIGAEEQAIDDAAVEVATARADDLAFEQAILAKTDRDLQVLSARYAGTPQGMAAEQARRAVAAQQAVRAGEAAAAAEKAQREREKHAAEMRKLGAEATIAERKAARAGMGGAPAGKEYGARTDISEDALIDPISGVVLGESRFQDRGKVREDQDTVNKFSTSMQDIAKYVELLKKVGSTYQGWGAKAVKSSDVKQLEAMHGDLLMKTRQALTGAAASQQEEEIIRNIIPPPKSYLDMGSWDPADVMRLYRGRMSEQYKNFLTSRLKTGGTLIRGQKGETLPTSPTYTFDIENGRAPVEQPGDRVFRELARDYPENPVTPMRETLIRQAMQRGATEAEAVASVDRREKAEDPFQRAADKALRDAAALKGEARDAAIDAIERSRDALKATGANRRAKYLDDALKQFEAGRLPLVPAEFDEETD